MNKKLSIITLALSLSSLLFAQIEKEVQSTIKKVTVFTQGAQIEQEATVSLQQGSMMLKFTRLSPYINKESIRIDGDGSFTILSVQHQNDFVNELERNKEIETIKDKIENLQMKVEDEEVAIKSINDKLDFMHANKDVTGKEQSISPEIFKTYNSIYGTNVETLNLDILKKQRLINDYKKEITKLNNQLVSLNNKANLPSGTILVSIDCKQTKTSKIKFNYLVDNASWYPSYDIRFVAPNKPLTITYKANIRQNTGVDWKNTNIVLSTAKTNISAQIPELQTYYLDFYTPRNYSYEVNSSAQLLQGRVAGLSVKMAKSAPEEEMDLSIPTTYTSKRLTSNEYIIDAEQTVLSNNKITTVSYREANLDADFEYQSIPKLSDNVFLIGRLKDWYKAEFMTGEANIYLENSFVGKSTINAEQFGDTMDISFGIDNNISIKREKMTELTEKKVIGANKKETLAYKISIRNNKNYEVSAKISDQIPVSTTTEIEVESMELSGGKLDKDAGKVTWDITLKPNENKNLIIKYSVKYPKNKQVIVE